MYESQNLIIKAYVLRKENGEKVFIHFNRVTHIEESNGLGIIYLENKVKIKTKHIFNDLMKLYEKSK